MWHGAAQPQGATVPSARHGEVRGSPTTVGSRTSGCSYDAAVGPPAGHFHRAGRAAGDRAQIGRARAGPPCRRPGVVAGASIPGWAGSRSGIEAEREAPRWSTLFRLTLAATLVHVLGLSGLPCMSDEEGGGDSRRSPLESRIEAQLLSLRGVMPIGGGWDLQDLNTTSIEEGERRLATRTPEVRGRTRAEVVMAAMSAPVVFVLESESTSSSARREALNLLPDHQVLGSGGTSGVTLLLQFLPRDRDYRIERDPISELRESGDQAVERIRRLSGIALEASERELLKAALESGCTLQGLTPPDAGVPMGGGRRGLVDWRIQECRSRIRAGVAKRAVGARLIVLCRDGMILGGGWLDTLRPLLPSVCVLAVGMPEWSLAARLGLGRNAPEPLEVFQGVYLLPWGRELFEAVLPRRACHDGDVRLEESREILRLRSADVAERRRAAWQLRRSGVEPGGASDLLFALRDVDAHVREDVMLAISSDFCWDAEIMPNVVAQLEDPVPAVRRAAISALDLCMRDASEVQAALVRRVNDEAELVAVRSGAAIALGRVWAYPDRVVPWLCQYLGTAEVHSAERLDILRCLVGYGHHAFCARDIFARAADDGDAGVRELGIAGLKGLGGR